MLEPDEPEPDVAEPPPNGKPDSEIASLLRRARAGEAAALDEILHRLMPLVWNVARAQGLDADAASDVAQKAWMKLVEAMDKIHTPQALASWLIVVTRREAWRVRQAGRREDLVEPDSLAELVHPADDPAAVLVTGERDRVLWRNIAKLSHRCQELLRIIAFVDRPNYTALAEALDMPKGSIGPTRGRCLEKLRKLLNDDPGWSTP
ncbi:MAG TPA: sigma-70 family RNA polymerase sigma factor [Pseudonocardiaceae bacterium]|jgi:RNA polymerase sigma factor (sigma-70 family)